MSNDAEGVRLQQARIAKIPWISTETTAPAWGASHQTGWTGLVAKLIELFGRLDAEQLLAGGKADAFARKESTVRKQAQVA